MGLFDGLVGYEKLILGVVITTIGWVLVTLLTKPSDQKTLDTFQTIIFDNESKFKNVGSKILAFVLGITGVYSFLFATGNWIYGKTNLAIGLSVLTVICVFGLQRLWKRIS